MPRMTSTIAISPHYLDDVPAPLLRVSVLAYQQMIAAGVFAADEGVELLDGYLVRKMARNAPHDQSVELVQAELLRRVPAGWRVRVQSAIVLPTSQPEPDLVVARGEIRQRPARHPEPSEIGLVVEVADASLATDHDVKLPLYAAANIPVYWIVNIPERVVEVYTDPTGPRRNPGYRTRRDYRDSDEIVIALDDHALAPVAAADVQPEPVE